MSDRSGESGAKPTSSPDPGGVLAEVKELYLFRLGGMAKDGGVYSAAAITALRRGAERFFDEITRRTGRAGFEQARDLTASKIQLINDDQLELSIRLGEVSGRLFDNCQGVLYRLHLRFITLLERPDLDGTDNPVGPEGIGCGLGEMLGELGGSVAKMLDVLRDVEEVLERDLPVLYADLNELLVRHGVAQVRRPGIPDSPARQSSLGGSAAPDPLAALQRLMLDRLPAGQAADPQLPFAGTGAASMAVDPARIELLLARLDALQRPAPATTDMFGGGDMAPHPWTGQLASIKGSDFATTANAPESAAIDVLALVFEAVFDDPRLPDGIKAAIGRLQIPLVKVAMIDSSLFDNPAHPARVLLDHMARAALGLPRETGTDHPVCEKLHQVAQRIQAEFVRDLGVLDQYTAELETFIARRNHDIQQAGEKFIALAEEQERYDLAAIDSRRAVETTLAGECPPIIADFATRFWLPVLAGVHVEHGIDSSEWQAHVSVLSDLAWSVQPKQTPEDRKRLGGLVAELMRRINDGLNRVGVGGTERAPFLDACLALQTAALRGKTVALPPADTGNVGDAIDYRPTFAARSDTLEPQRSSRQDGARQLEVVRLPHGAGGGRVKGAGSVRGGDWIEFMLPGGEVRCGRLCWLSPALHSPLFFNDTWSAAISLAPAILERQLRDGIASTLSARSLFDAMADKALRALSAPR